MNLVRMCAIALSGAAVCGLLAGCTEADSRAAPIASERPPALQVRDALTIESVAPRTGELGDAIPARVAFRLQALASVSVPVQARVVAVHVSPGDVVQENAPLMTLKGAEVAATRTALAQAAARAAAAEDMLARQTEMLKRGVGLEVERFGAEIAAREAAAELDRAQRAADQLGEGSNDEFKLRAPTGGVVTHVRARIGAMSSPDGEALVDIGNPDKLFVIADVAEHELAAITVGQPAKVAIRSIGATYDAIVERIGRTVDADQRRVPVYIGLSGTTKPLSPGMLVDVRMQTDATAQLSLPVEAVLIKDGDRYIVYVENEAGVLQARSITIGASRNGRVAVTDGLRFGEKVVVKGALLLDSSSEQLL
ncbi:efflux RND transporter periplasmic adaptor subunit [Hyphomicrobium sp. D-2]|uniref:efflux RND transporter periplasmic adaptor subunit n=1 Tax=Hyphomicrobium sp. D-2 TaxID=3041621 RepID=UPI00245461AE|nr:efflux RND transporter periplasmic adaptor subunit [Hyphomicrobium sp. D-2]MDH4982031.1 efflux RND transporter periplasmic adaptor subunit [Hyphomicrobium sp. D-2]